MYKLFKTTDALMSISQFIIFCHDLTFSSANMNDA